LEFRDISRVSGAITAKRMEIDPYRDAKTCQKLLQFDVLTTLSYRPWC